MAKKGDEAKIKFTAETAEMRDEIKDADRTMKELRSELRLNEEQMKTVGTSAEGLEKRYDILQKESEQYEKKLEALNGELEVAAEVWGEGSQEAENLRIRINNTGAAYEKVKQQMAATKSELEQCRREMGSSGDEADDTRSAYEKLSDTIQEQKEELSKLQEEYKNAVLQYGKNSKEAGELKSEMQSLSKELRNNEAAMDKLESMAQKASGQMNNLEDSARDAGEGFTVAKGAVATFAGNALTELVNLAKQGASQIYNLAEETRDYRNEMNKLSSSAEDSGYSAEYAKEKYMDMYAVLADETAANTTVSNFMAMKLNQEDLNRVLNAATGIWAKYGDSIPLDGLAESVNETSRAGKITGNLADALNWAGINEDEFNEKLAMTNSTSERQQLIIDTLEYTYGELSDAYKKNNKNIMAANRATAEYNDVMADLGEEMEPITTEVKKGITEVLKAAMKLDDADTEEVVEKIGDAFEWVADNIDTILTLAKVGAGTVGAMFAIDKAAKFVTNIKTLTTTMGLFTASSATATTATTTQTGAQLGLNAAMSANPVGLLITAFATAAVVIGTVCAATTSAEGELKAYREEMEAAREASDQMLEDVRNTISGWEDQIDTIDDNANAMLRLKDELFALAEKENKTISDKQKMKMIVEELNESVDGLNLVLDEETYALNMTSGAVEGYIEAMVQLKKKEQAMDNAVQASIDLEEATRGLTSAEEELRVAKEATTKAEKAYNDALDEYKEKSRWGTANTYAYKKALADLDVEYEKAIETEKTAQNEYDNSKKAVDEITESYNRWLEMVGDTSAFDDSAESYVTFEGTVYRVSQSVAESMQNLQKEYEATKTELEESVASQIGLFDELSLESEMSIDEMIANLISQQEAMDKWAENVKLAAEKGIDEGIIQELNDGSVESAQILNEIVNSSDEKIQELNAAFAGAKGAKNELVDAMADVQTGFTESMNSLKEGAKENGESVGINTVEGIVKGMQRKKDYLLGSVSTIGQGMYSRFKDIMQIRSPSRLFAGASEFIPEGIALGIENNADVAVGAVENMTEGIASAYRPFDLISNGGLLEDHASNAMSRYNSMFPDVIKEDAYAAENMQVLETMFSKLANRPIVLEQYINDRQFAQATAGASDHVNGLRNSLKTRGLVIDS